MRSCFICRISQKIHITYRLNITMSIRHRRINHETLMLSSIVFKLRIRQRSKIRSTNKTKQINIRNLWRNTILCSSSLSITLKSRWIESKTQAHAFSTHSIRSQCNNTGIISSRLLNCSIKQFLRSKNFLHQINTSI